MTNEGYAWATEKCRTCKHAFTTGKDRWYCKKSLADKYDCKSYEMAVKTLEQGTKNDVLDKIRSEFISLYPKNYAGEPELGGLRCVFSLDKVLSVIDKYNTESEG